MQEEATEPVIQQAYDKVIELLFYSIFRTIPSYVTKDHGNNPWLTTPEIAKTIQTAIKYFQQFTDKNTDIERQSDVCSSEVQTFLQRLRFTDLFYSTSITGAYIHPQVEAFSVDIQKLDDGWSRSKKENKQIIKKAAQDKEDLLVLIDCIKAGIKFLEKSGITNRRTGIKYLENPEVSTIVYKLDRDCQEYRDSSLLEEPLTIDLEEQRNIICQSILRNCLKKYKSLI